MEQERKILQSWIQESGNIVFFGGAGVSTESGIPDFRSVDGLYHQKYRFPPETILSHPFFIQHTEEFYDFYRDKLLHLSAQPNLAHKRLAQWEALGKVKAVITQNIDGLHTKAGSKNVLELHGSVHRNLCRGCSKSYDAQFIKESAGVPRCPVCGALIKPDVVLYEESLSSHLLKLARIYLSQAEVLIIGGTSLAVYPAAGLIDYYQGKKLVVINQSPTPLDNRADLVISGSIGQVLDAVQVE